MALDNFRSFKIIRLLIFVFIALPVVSANVDCGGKAFHCVNTTHFKICVDLGGGVSKTIDSFIIPCPVSTECRKTNRYECEFPKPVILETVNATSVPDERSPVTAAITVSADTSGSTPTEFLQFVTGTSESSKTELYKITTDFSVVDKTKSFKMAASNSEQGTTATEYLQTLINTNTPNNIELIEVPIGKSVTNAKTKTELYETSNQTGLKNKTEISDELTNTINTSEFSQGLTDFTTPATTKILEISSGIRFTNTSKFYQVLDIQPEFTQEVVEMSAPITTEIFQNLKDKIVFNETETFEVSKNTSVTNNIGYKQDPTEASELIKSETAKLSKQTGLTNESEFYQEPVFTSVPSTTETLKFSTYTSVTSRSTFLKSHNRINELITAEMFQTSTDGIIPNETELFESSTTSRVLKKSDIFQGPDEISATITNGTFQSSSFAIEPNKTDLFATSIDSRVLNSSENYQGLDGISEHKMLRTSTNAPNKSEVLETFTTSRIINISDMFQESDNINAPLTTEISKNLTVANELNKTELFESSTDSTVLKGTVLSQGPDKTRALISAKILNKTTNASALNKTDLFEVSTDANEYETVTNQPDLFEAVLHTRLPFTTKVSQTMSDTNEHFVLQSNSNGTYTQRSNYTVGNDKNDMQPTTENSVSNKSVLHQGYLEITTPFKVNILKTSIENNILNVTEIFQAPAATNLTAFNTTEFTQAEILREDKNNTATFSPSSKTPLKVTYPSIVTREQGVENQIEWSNITYLIDSTKENHSIIDFNNHTALATEVSNSNDLLNQNIMTKVNSTFLVTKNVSLEYENTTAINSFVGVMTVNNNTNNFIPKKLSNGHNDFLMSLNKEYTSDATESNNLINSVSNSNDLGIMASSNRPIDSTTYDTTESHFTTFSSQDFTTETVSNKNNENKVIEVNGYTFDVNTFAVLTPPTVTIQDYSYHNTELQDFPSIITENSTTTNNNFVSKRTMKTTILNKTNLEAINNKNNVSADEINTSSVYVTNKETVKVLEAMDLPYKVFTPVIHNSVTTQDWGAVGMNPQLEITTNAITSSELNSKDFVVSNLKPPESYINISKSLHKAIVTDDLFSKNTSNINVQPEASENSTQMRNMHTEQIEYLRNVSTLSPTDSQIKITGAATETSIFKAEESAVTIVKELTQLQELSPAAKTEFQSPSSLVASSFDLDQTSSINSIAETNADHKKNFVTESNIVESTTIDAVIETSILKAVESAATIVKELTQPQKLSTTSREQTGSINSFAKTSEDYKKQIVTKSNIVEFKTTDAATETSILKSVESAATDVKELTQTQKLSPTPSSLVDNSFDLEQIGSINSIAETTSADHKKHIVTESNIVESKTTDAATDTSKLKKVESAVTDVKELTQPQKQSPTPSSLVANGFGLEQTGAVNSIAKTPADYKKHFVTGSIILESKTTDATIDTSIFKTVDSAATVIKELTQPQKLSPIPSSLVTNGFDLEQTGSINSITETTLESTTYLNYLDSTENNLGNGQNLVTGRTKKTTPSVADIQHFTEQISAALNIAETAFPAIHEQKILYSKDIDLQKNTNVQHNPSETSLKEQRTQQRAMNQLDKQTKRVNQDVIAVHNLNINNTQFSVTSEPFFTVSDTQVEVIPIGTNLTKKVSSIAHSLINHMVIPTSSNTFYSEAETSNDGSRMSLELPENKSNESKHNQIQSPLTLLLNNTIREPTVDLVNKLKDFKNTTDDQSLGANKAVTSEADLTINSTSLLLGVSKDKASETSFKTHPSESTTKYRDFINTTSHLNKDLALQGKVHVNESKDTKKDNLSQTELKKYKEIAKSVISKNDTLRSIVRGSTYPQNATYVSDIKTFEAPTINNNKPYAEEVEVESFINSNTYIKTNHTLNTNGSISEVLNVDRTQISNKPKAKTNIVNDVLNKSISLLLNVSKNFTLLNKSVTERIQLRANGNYTNSEKDQLHAAHNEHINTTVRSMYETEYNKTTDRLPENKSEHRKEDKLLITNDEHNESQNKRRNLMVSRDLENASHLKSDHHSVLSSNIRSSSLTPIIDGRQKVSTLINPKRSVITIPKYIGAAQATYIDKDIALVNQTQRTVLANVNNNFTSTTARKATKIIRAHATINNAKKNISFNCRNRNRGRYSDTDDCNKFYICIGKLEPIIGRCPVNTVFSELKKQCTNNMSHCVRGSEFKCTAAGRFIDIFKQNVYYICLKSNQHFIRYTFQCQKGYYLNRTLLKCIADSELEMQSQTSISNDNSKSEISNNEDNKSNKDISKTRHSQKSGEKFECEEEGKFADENDCRRYYVCKKNHKSEFRRRKKKCDSDELFHKDRKKCVDAESYEC